MAKRGRPPKPARERKTLLLQIPVSKAEKSLIQVAAKLDGVKPVTWAREVLVRESNKRIPGSK